MAPSGLQAVVLNWTSGVLRASDLQDLVQLREQKAPRFPRTYILEDLVKAQELEKSDQRGSS